MPVLGGFASAAGSRRSVLSLLHPLARHESHPHSFVSREPPLSAALSLHSRVTMLKPVASGATLGYGGTFRTERDSLIATIPIGYYDGLRRAYSNNGRVIVRDRFAPIVGRVSMDLTILDVTDINGVGLGDEVILIGRSGDLAITAEDMGSWIGTISFEVSCAISDRVPRIYSKQ